MGGPLEVLRASRATEPIDLAVLVDNSQAVTPYISDLRTAIQAFVERMTKGGHHVALIGLADRPTILADYTNNPAQAVEGRRTAFSRSPAAARRCSTPSTTPRAACRSAMPSGASCS